MKKFVIASVFAVLAMAGVVMAADPVKSGLATGEFVPAFNVKDCTGPNEGKTLCYRCQYGNRPVVAVFTRRMTDDVSALVKGLDEAVGTSKESQLKAFVVFMSDNPDAAETQLKKAAATGKISQNVPLTVFQTSEGPDNYEISKDAEVTVMLWNKSKVTQSKGFAKDQKLSAEDVKKFVDSAKGLK